MTANVETLRAQLAKAEAAEQAAEQARQDTILQAQTGWRENVHARGRELDDQLEAQGMAHYQAARDAAVSGDLAGAYAEYTAWHGTRAARYLVRSQSQSASTMLGKEPYTRADLGARDVNFSEFLTQAINTAAALAGEVSLETSIGEIPVDHDAAVAWLETNRGE